MIWLSMERGWLIRIWGIADGRWGLLVNVNVKVEKGWHAGVRGWDRDEGACGGWERRLG